MYLEIIKDYINKALDKFLRNILVAFSCGKNNFRKMNQNKNDDVEEHIYFQI